MGGIRFKTYDLGGHETARRIWRDYYATVDAVVYLVDAADRTRFHEASESLRELTDSPELSQVPFVVLGNKIDLDTAASEEELRQALGLFSHNTYGRDHPGESKVRPIEVFMCSVVRRAGYHDGERSSSVSRSLPVAFAIFELVCVNVVSCTNETSPTPAENYNKLAMIAEDQQETMTSSSTTPASTSAALPAAGSLEVHVDAAVLLQVARHCRDSLPGRARGMLMALVFDSRVEVTSSFAFPAKKELEKDGAVRRG